MESPPLRALILTNGGARGSLAAVRALGRAGWHVAVGTPGDPGIVAASRWCRRVHVVPPPQVNGDAFADALRSVIARGGYSVVFGGGDDWVGALAAHRDGLPARVAHPDAGSVSLAFDKLELGRRARRAGLSAPRTEPSDGPTLRSWDGAVVVKCRTHWVAGQSRRGRIDTQRFDDPSHAHELVRTMRRAGFEPVLQEVVTGRLEALSGLFDRGRLRGRVQQIAHGVWPVPDGVSCRAETVPVDEDLAERVDVLLDDIGWSGLVELQFLRPPGGDPHLIDLNGRFYGSMPLAIAAGTNLPDAWGRLTLGLPVPGLPDARPGVRYVWLGGDLRRAWAERRGGLVADVSATIAWSLTGTTSVVDLRDPRPTVAYVADGLRRARG